MMIKKLAALVAVFALMAGGLTACTQEEKKADDTTITQSVKTKLSEDATLTGTNIEVTTMEGVVTLNGMVDNNEQMEAAKKAAESAEGVKQVDSKLTLKGQNP